MPITQDMLDKLSPQDKQKAIQIMQALQAQGVDPHQAYDNPVPARSLLTPQTGQQFGAGLRGLLMSRVPLEKQKEMIAADPNLEMARINALTSKYSPTTVYNVAQAKEAGKESVQPTDQNVTLVNPDDQSMVTKKAPKGKVQILPSQKEDIIYRKADTGEEVDPETAKADIAAGNKDNYAVHLKHGGKETPLMDFGQSRLEMTKMRTWQDIQQKANPRYASQGTSLGMAAVNDQRADRALGLLNKTGKLTPQELSIITTDLAAIVRGGVPTDIGSREAEYSNLSTGVAGWLQKLNSGTADIDSPEVRDQLRQDMADMKNLSRNIINDNFDYIESAQSGFIKSHKNDWENMRAPYRQSAETTKPTGQGNAEDRYQRYLQIVGSK